MRNLVPISDAGSGPAIAAILVAAAALSCTGPDRVFPQATGTTSAGSMSGGGGSGGSSSSVGSGAQGGTGGGTDCGDASHTCVPETPGGWEGPVALTLGPGDGVPTACIGEYGTKLGDYKGDLDPGVAHCSCDCAAATQIACTSSAELCYGANCIQACFGTDATVPPGQCVNIPVSGSVDVTVSDPPPTNMGSCMPQTDNALPDPMWGASGTACEGATTSPTGCEAGEVCAPKTFDPDIMCIAHTGDVACPDPYYSEKHLLHEGFMNDRACSPCSCGNATSVCGGSVTFTRQNCTIALGDVDAGACGTKNNGADAENANYSPQPSGTCPPAGGVLSGSVVETGTLTFCCH